MITARAVTLDIVWMYISKMLHLLARIFKAVILIIYAKRAGIFITKGFKTIFECYFVTFYTMNFEVLFTFRGKKAPFYITTMRER